MTLSGPSNVDIISWSGSIRYITELVGLKIFHGTSNTVIGWHGYGQGRGPSHFTEPAILRFAGTVMARSGPVTFHGASNTVVG